MSERIVAINCRLCGIAVETSNPGRRLYCGSRPEKTGCAYARLKQRRIEDFLRHRAEYNQRSRDGYRKNRIQRMQYSMQWQKENRAKVNWWRSRRRHQLRGSGVFSYEEWQYVKELFNGCCAGCGRSEKEVKLTIDHKVPVSKNGSNSIDNVQPLCLSCNDRKGTKVQFAACDLISKQIMLI